tara:strand:+ start:1873 stop:2772 length:900 start_codon:yes stop_codon:yes gene_type:complete
MRILLAGARGQLGIALQECLPRSIELIACSRKDFDLVNLASCREIIARLKPDWIINAAAYTAVDQAELDEDLAYSVNAKAPKALALALAKYGGRLLQISTDFVFNGKQGCSYNVKHPIDPINVYGLSKARGEEAVKLCPGSYVIRTSWLYGPIGQNFFLTMLRLHNLKGQEGKCLSVVSDQISCPTSTKTLAKACWKIISSKETFENSSIFHCCDAGVASWYDFAVAIGEMGVQFGVFQKSADVRPISSLEYPTKAQRPAFSLLDCTSTCEVLDLERKHWRQSLSEVFTQFVQINGKIN